MPHYISESCGGCGTCKLFCPVLAISGEKNLRHQINPLRCIDCSVCGRLCTKSAVLNSEGNTVGRIPRKLWPMPVINKSKCSACGICVESCRFNALAVSLPKNKGDIRVSAELISPQKCVSCSLCERRCPMRAITLTPAPSVESPEAGEIAV